MIYVFFPHSESANEYTDDEDASWKVRRAAAKCLAGLIVSRSEMISKVYQEVYIFFLVMTKRIIHFFLQEKSSFTSVDSLALLLCLIMLGMKFYCSLHC